MAGRWNDGVFVAQRMDKKTARIGKSDLLLIGVLLAVGIAGMLAVRFGMGREGAAVRITVDGAEYGVYELSKEQDVPISTDGTETNTLRIFGAQAKMVKADCPDKLCVRQRAISRKGETIVCLPHKVVVEIEGAQAAELDSVSR